VSVSARLDSLNPLRSVIKRKKIEWFSKLDHEFRIRVSPNFGRVIW
jgi:hypothetical protein